MLPLLNPYFELSRTLLHSQIDPPSLETARKKLIWAYSWAIPSNEVIQEVSRYSPLLELGAGTGYWGWLIRQAGGLINCWDSNSSAGPHWSEVEYGTPEMLTDFPGLESRTLLLVWPPLDEPMAEYALIRFTGKHVIYAGEWRGRTGSAGFHDRLESDYRIERIIELPQWPGYTDSLRIYSRF